MRYRHPVAKADYWTIQSHVCTNHDHHLAFNAAQHISISRQLERVESSPSSLHKASECNVRDHIERQTKAVRGGGSVQLLHPLLSS